MNKILLTLCALLLLFSGCSQPEEYADDPVGNFDSLTRTLQEHYCFFREKGIDWPEVVAEYRAKVSPTCSQRELFSLCSQMLDTLRDGHVNLASRFDTYYYRRWWSDYPADFNLRTVQQYYLHFAYSQVSGMTYARLPQGIGYIYIPSLSVSISETSLSYVLDYLRDCPALILDIRGNGGGMLTSAETIVRCFLDSPTTVGYIRHKTGPGPDDFSEPFPVTYLPAPPGWVRWMKPVAVLTNRGCFSAANDLVMCLKPLPRVRIVGARTGGGAGLPFSAGLPNGWNLRFSACPTTDAQGLSTEEGIDPSPGCEVHAPDSQLAQGQDAILDFAINLLCNPSLPALSGK